MPYIQYNYDPNDPNSKYEARAKAFGQYFLGMISFWGSLCSIIYFIFELSAAFNANFSKDIITATGLIILMAVIDFFFLFHSWDKQSIKEMAKKYFLFFFGGLVDLSGLIALYSSLKSLFLNEGGTDLLIVALLAIVISTTTVVLIFRRLKGYAPVKLFSDKDASQFSHTGVQKNDCVPMAAYFFCHKCGKQLPEDSAFCSSCGTKLR